jgi:hypothetical protein
MSVPAENMNAGLSGAVDSGIATANGDDEATQAEIADVQKLFTEYTVAREFDESARQQYEKDRRYAQGIANRNWASDANIIGAFIDILVSFLYAKDPDVSARPAARVTPPIPKPGELPPPPSDTDHIKFAETAQIVISQQWRKARLKRTMKKCVRSSLSVGPGWFKAMMYREDRANPLLEKELKDSQDNLARIQKLQEDLTRTETDEEIELKVAELNRQIAGVQARIEASVKKGMCIDFIRSEDIQVSLDVSALDDCRDADWMSQDLYVERGKLKQRFPRLTDTDVAAATAYVQRHTGQAQKQLAGDVMTMDTKLPAGAFVKGTDNPGLGATTVGGAKPVEFVKVVELWDQREGMIKTMVDGVNRWAREAYPPPQATSRFYPFFLLAFFETDGARHPQSLSWRLYKLQDEYSSRRSSGRKMRERSIPATVFDKGALDPEEAKLISESVEQEFIGIRTTVAGAKLADIVSAKPVAAIDPAVFATTEILYDMNVLSGVQEAQASGASNANTATEADIQQSGFASRTDADRDIEEDLLTDLAQYTLEVAIQSLTPEEVSRIAGPYAYWPYGMEVDDVLMMLDVEVQGGTTGKPRAKADKEAWATLLPLVINMFTQIKQAELMGDIQTAQTLKNIMNETLKRLDDRLTIDAIIAPAVAPVLAPGMPGASPTSADPGAAAPIEDPAAPPVGNGTINNPGAQAAAV